MSLAAINVARAFARQDKMGLSVGSVKTLIHNSMMIHSFSVLSDKLTNKLLNTNEFKELLYYGVANAAWLFKIYRTIVYQDLAGSPQSYCPCQRIIFSYLHKLFFYWTDSVPNLEAKVKGTGKRTGFFYLR